LVDGNNEAATVTTIGDFAAKSGVVLPQKSDKNGLEIILRFVLWERGDTPIDDSRHWNNSFQAWESVIRNKGIICFMPWNKLFHPMEQSVPPYGTNRKVPAEQVVNYIFVD